MRRPCARQRQRHDHPLLRVMTKANPLPSLELLKKEFDYDANTGMLLRKKNNTKAGHARSKPTGKSTKCYIEVRVGSKKYFAHRIIWYIVTGADPKEDVIDHIDGDGLNNLFANLRRCSQGENARNRSLNKNSTTGLKGACLDKRNMQFQSYICINKKQIHLGYFPTAELAHMAYCKAAAELHEEFARGA